MDGSRKRGERGSALMLVPAGVLVLVVLAAIAVDSAIAFGAQRELINQASAAANDAVTVAIPGSELQKGEAARPDAGAVDRYVRNRLVGREVSGYTLTNDDVSVGVEDDVVDIDVRARVPFVFAGAVPGADGEADIVASAAAELRFSAG